MTKFDWNFNDETNFPHKLLLANAKVSKIRKAFANGSSANIKFSKTQFHRIGQSRGRLVPNDLFYPFKMRTKAVEKVEDVSKNTNKISKNN